MSGTILAKIENRTFDTMTIAVAGSAFVNCKFLNCTLIITNATGMLNGCTFTGCSWLLNLTLTHADLATRAMLKSLLAQMDAGDSVSFSAN